MVSMLKTAAVLLLATITPAAAHVSLAQPTAVAGSHSVATFRIGHGCGTSPTTAIRVTIPQAITTARPQPKPGWTLELAQQDSKTTAITWKSGNLPADQFDEFSILLDLPDAPTTLLFPVTQTCEGAVANWNQPPDGITKFPAPQLTVTAPDPHAAMHHMH